jgi:hypothetical protein
MTFGMFLSHCDAGDPLAFLSYYLPSLVIAFFAILFLNAFILFCLGSKPKYAFALTASIVCCWGIYFIATASENMTLTLLGSESPEAAEFAYQKSFKINLDQAIRLAAANPGEDDVEGQTVRFYAACRIADILESSNRDFQNRILNQLQDAPMVTPAFIGTNSINFIFGDPDWAHPPLPVSEIIQRRLVALGKPDR